MIRDGDRAEQRRRHQLAPVEHVAAHQLGDGAARHGAHLGLGQEDQGVEELVLGQGEDAGRDEARPGRYPTETICKVVREHRMLSLEDAHWRLSALPEVAGFRGRGQLRRGAPADIVVYDFDGLRVLSDEIAHDLPGGEWRRIQRADGYKYILVNGEVTMRDGRPTNTHSGRLLRHGGGARSV